MVAFEAPMTHAPNIWHSWAQFGQFRDDGDTIVSIGPLFIRNRAYDASQTAIRALSRNFRETKEVSAEPAFLIFQLSVFTT